MSDSLNPVADFLNSLPKPERKRRPQQDHSWKPRYNEAYNKHFIATYPAAYKAHGLIKCKFPDVSKATGLQNAIENYINWNGYRATRISTTGRKIGDKWIPGTTRRGTSDISATINGRAVMLEVKTGADKPSGYQLKEQAREIAAGGLYYFIHNMGEFYECYDKILKVK